MAAVARKHDGRMARTVREVLGSVFAPDLRDRILEDALDRGRESTVPEEAARARDFVEGPLRATIFEHGGIEAADAVMEGLDPILEMAGSHVRMKDTRRVDETQVEPRRAPSTIPAPAADDEIPGEDSHVTAAQRPVMMATLDRTGVDGVARCLVGRAEVRQVGDVFDLVSAMDVHSSRAPLLVIDCCLPAVDPATVATMLPVVPRGSRVILWGATERMRADLELVAPAAAEWIACAADATHEDLASLLASFM